MVSPSSASPPSPTLPATRAQGAHAGSSTTLHPSVSTPTLPHPTTTLPPPQQGLLQPILPAAPLAPQAVAQFSSLLFPPQLVGPLQVPTLQAPAEGSVWLPNLQRAVPTEAYLAMTHLHLAIMEADRLAHPFRKSLALRPKCVDDFGALAITALQASNRLPNLYFKREDQTAIKAYKARGAFCGMKRVMDTHGERHFLAVSTGNHALGILRAADLLRPATVRIVVPNNTSEVKLKSINTKVLAVRHRGVEASVLYIGDTFDEARAWAMEQSQVGEGYYLDPYSNPWVVAGQGTIGLELYRQLLPLVQAQPLLEEVVLISPIGGGGLLAGTATALTLAMGWDARTSHLKLRFLGLPLQQLDSEYGDAIRVKHPAEGNRALFSALGVQQMPVTDAMMAWGMLHTQAHLGGPNGGDRVEGPSGVPLTVALHHEAYYPNPKRLVVCMVSGGNVSAFPSAH